MGNAESCGALQAELAKLEDTLAVLAVTNPVGCRPLLPHHIQLRGCVLRCKQGVAVVVGPVVGAVGPDYARILLEVDMSTTVTCHVSRRERVTGQWLEVDAARVAVDCVKGRPSIFHMKHLLPGTSYAYAMEAQVVERLRDAYRFQWSLPSVRRVLANTSNLMMWSDEDIYRDFTTSATFHINHEAPTIQMQVMRVLLRSARRVYHEYQRQLWDVDFHEFRTQTSAELDKHLALAKRKMDFDMVKRCESRLSELKTLTANAPDNPVFSPVQWDFVLKVLADVTLRVLVVCSELPLVDDSNANIQAFMTSSKVPSSSSSSRPNPRSSCRSWWGAAPRDQQRLLTLVSEWKLQKPNRELVLLSGASSMGGALASTVTDMKMRTEFHQHVVGPIAGPCHTALVPTRTGVVADRFAFQHDVVLPGENNFAVLTLAAAEGRDPVVTCRRVGQVQ
ncbi:hypothetical protein DYB31_003166 [Aphanomyces astaci]|uniref:Uncharacterized protein n=2 Tax=Aphanomyces astaci TaxID=112090 RepID=A0A397EA10_APHAT|nr:hypothetical protein DYB31_003166 [Aphanomyces astaci]